MWTAVRDRHGQPVPLFELTDEAEATLRSQAEAQGLSLAQWIETVLRVGAEVQETRPVPGRVADTEFLELDLDPETWRRVRTMWASWPGNFLDAGGTAATLLLSVNRPGYVEMVQQLTGRQPEQVAGVLVAQAERDLGREFGPA